MIDVVDDDSCQFFATITERGENVKQQWLDAIEDAEPAHQGKSEGTERNHRKHRRVNEGCGTQHQLACERIANQDVRPTRRRL